MAVRPAAPDLPDRCPIGGGAGAGAADQSAAGPDRDLRNFAVTVDEVREGGNELLVRARVCVRKLPPDPQGDRTRISWDPWRAQFNGARSRPSVYDGSHPPANMFPREGLYRVGSCASGWLPFSDTTSSQTLESILYENGLGNVATWDPGPARDSPPPANKRVSWTFPEPFIPNGSERFSSKTLDGPAARFDAASDFHTIYQVRGLTWQGWASAVAIGQGRARRCAETCDEWRSVTIRLSEIKGIECGDNDLFSYYTRHRLTGFGSRNGEQLISPAFC